MGRPVKLEVVGKRTAQGDELKELRQCVNAQGDELKELRQLVEAQGAEIGKICASQRITHGEEVVKVAALLEAISEEFGYADWTVAWLFEAALDTTPGANDLLRAITAITGKGRSHKKLGVFLSQHLGVTGRWRLTLQRGRTREGNFYSVTDLSHLSQSTLASMKQ